MQRFLIVLGQIGALRLPRSALPPSHTLPLPHRHHNLLLHSHHSLPLPCAAVRLISSLKHVFLVSHNDRLRVCVWRRSY
jgi:hypothetical protein